MNQFSIVNGRILEITEKLAEHIRHEQSIAQRLKILEQQMQALMGIVRNMDRSMHNPNL